MKLINRFIIMMCSLFILYYSIGAEANVTANGRDLQIRLDSYIEEFMNEQRIPGASIMLLKGEDVIYQKNWGVTGEDEQPITSSTPFTIGSISKSFTGLAMVKLEQEGLVDLEAPVQKYLPWFTLQDQQAATTMTIKHLLSHTSGFTTYTGLLLSDQELVTSITYKSMTEKLSEAKLTAMPGEKHQYSNANYIILGAIIEEVSKQTYSDYMHQRIFEPLGMDNAAAELTTAIRNGYRTGYQSLFGYPVKSTVEYDNSGSSYGYITASSEDLAKFLKLISNTSTNRLLNDDYLNKYLTPLVQVRENRYYGYGLRTTLPDKKGGELSLWHSGSTPDSHGELFYFPEEGLGGVILTNKNHILEESALPALKKGIIQLVNNEQPEDIPGLSRNTQLFLTLFVLICIILLLYIILARRRAKIRYTALRVIIGTVMLLASILTVPLVRYYTDSPFHSVILFAPDVAILMLMSALLVLLNGLVLLWPRKKISKGRRLELYK